MNNYVKIDIELTNEGGELMDDYDELGFETMSEGDEIVNEDVELLIN